MPDLTPLPLMRILLNYLADRVPPTLKELRALSLPEKLFVVESGYVEGSLVLSEITTIATTREDCVAWIEKIMPKDSIVHHETGMFHIRQSSRTRHEERFWTRILRLPGDKRPGPADKQDIQCGTYYAVVEIELRDLALHITNR